MKKKIVVVVFCMALGGIATSASVGAHPGVDCSNETACVKHCNTYHRGLTDRALCLVTHNFQS
jgi:hypothetical protein